MVTLAVVTVWCGGAQMMEMLWYCLMSSEMPWWCLVWWCSLEMTLPWSLDGDDMHWLDECLILWWWWWWTLVGAHALDDGLGAMLEMTYLDDMMTYMMEIAWWVSAIIWHDALACDEVSYTLSFTYPCASPTYSCNPLQDPHTPILNPNTPSYTLPCILLYPITLPIT